MSNFYIKKIGLAIIVLMGITILAFGLGVMSPGDPAEIALNQTGIIEPTTEQIKVMHEQLGLDKPLYIQYFIWLKNICSGDLGMSFATGNNIENELLLRIPVTLKLALMAVLWASFLGISIGVLSAINKDKWFDELFKIITNIMLAIPSFWLALLLILLFCEILKLFPISEGDSIQDLILPSFVVAFSTIGVLIRFTRNLLLLEFSKQYFIIAKLRGINKYTLIFKYAIPNIVVPILALLGNYLANILGGSVIVENIFALQGLGTLALQAISYRDYPVLQAYVLISGLVLVIITNLIDILIAKLDPKIKWR